MASFRRISGQLAVLVSFVAAAALGQQHSTPQSFTPGQDGWWQLRGGLDNRGVVAGNLDATWSFRADRPVRGMSIADSILILGSESLDADAAADKFSQDQRGMITAVNLRSGRKLWMQYVASWVHGDPAIYDSLVIATFGRWPMTFEGGVAAFDLFSGRPRWSVALPGGAMPAPAIDRDTKSVFVAGGNGILYQLSAVDGRILSRVGLRAPDGMSSPRITEHGAIVIGAGSSVSRFDSSLSRPVWSHRVRSLRALGDVPVAIGNGIVFSTGTRTVSIATAFHVLPFRQFAALTWEAIVGRPWSSYQGWFAQQWLIALDYESGKLLWRRSLGVGLEVPRNTSGTPVLNGQHVIVSSPVSRTVWAFDLNGIARWQRALPSVHKGAVTIARGMVTLGDRAGIVTIINEDDGAVLGRCRAGGAFTPTAPIVAGHSIIIPTKDRMVHVLPFDTLVARAKPETMANCFETAKARS